MAAFAAAFDIIENRACPCYNQDDIIVLTDRAVILPVGRPACLILIRELTEMLFTLLPHAADDFAGQRDNVYTCGGCTGLIKFRLGETPQNVGESGDGEGEVVMSGRIDAISPAELLQVFHMHQKTGKLLLDMDGGAARVTFRDGGIIAARFGELDNQEAIYAMMGEKRGHFRFMPGLPSPLMKAREIGDFMMILMEGLKRLDEDDEPPEE
jgi:hypothetical protein